MKTVSEIDHIEGKKILLRSDLNVPIEQGGARDVFRIERALPTLQFLISRGAKVILVTHLGDDGSADMTPIVKVLESYKVPLAYVAPIKSQAGVADESVSNNESATIAAIENAVAAIQNGNVLLLPNIRTFSGEKSNDITFSKWLAGLADVYVNDAFSVSHREHASIVGVPKYIPAFAGMQLLEEVEHLSGILGGGENPEPERPFVVLFGGAKLATKLPLIQKLSEKADITAIGGALLNQLLFARGQEVGKSFIDPNEHIDLSIFDNEKMIVPTDVVVVREDPSAGSSNGKSAVVGVSEIQPNDVIVDIGPVSTAKIEAALVGAKTVLWNGPMGKYEEGFGGSTEAILLKLATLSETVKVTVGGGDTVALVSQLGLQNKLHFVSTGGGATLEYLEKGTLPGIEAL